MKPSGNDTGVKSYASFVIIIFYGYFFTAKYDSDSYGISIREDQMNEDIPSGKVEVKKIGCYKST